MAITYTPLATTTLGSSQSTVTFSSISSSYTDLVLVASIVGTADSSVIFRFNNDSTSLYSQTTMAGVGTSTVTTGRQSNEGRFLISEGTGISTTNPSTLIASVNNYSNTSTNKTFLSRWGVPSATYPGTQALVGTYRSTSAISRIDLIAFSANFNSGSTFTIYGIKAA